MQLSDITNAAREEHWSLIRTHKNKQTYREKQDVQRSLLLYPLPMNMLEMLLDEAASVCTVRARADVPLPSRALRNHGRVARLEQI